MRPARLLVALDQRLVARVHEEDLVRIALFTELCEDVLYIGKGPVGAHIEPEDDLADLAPGHEHQLGELVDEADRQVVDAVISLIFQHPDRGGLAAAAHSRHDYKSHVF